MLREEYDRLVSLFEAASSGKGTKIEEVFAQSVEFFNHLRMQIEKGSPDEKKEAIAMMTELYKFMTQETKKICQTSGLSEEELLSYADNPANFSREQWHALQESKERISNVGHELAKTIYEKGKEGELPKSEAEKRGSSNPHRKPKRNDWLRS